MLSGLKVHTQVHTTVCVAVLTVVVAVPSTS